MKLSIKVNAVQSIDTAANLTASFEFEGTEYEATLDGIFPEGTDLESVITSEVNCAVESEDELSGYEQECDNSGSESEENTTNYTFKIEVV